MFLLNCSPLATFTNQSINPSDNSRAQISQYEKTWELSMRLVNSLARTIHVGVRHITTASTSPQVFLASLGNPEPEYSLTRHNIGHRFINQLIEIYWQDHIHKENGYYTSSKYPNITLFKDPQSYMNLQGKPISNHFSKFKNCQLFIVHDDVQNSVGKYKVRAKGSSAQGHNGLKSVIQYLGNNHTKLAIGVGRPPPNKPLDKWVLGKFELQELQTIDFDVIPKVVQELENLIQPNSTPI